MQNSKLIDFRTDSIWILEAGYSKNVFETEIVGLKVNVHLPRVVSDTFGFPTLNKPQILSGSDSIEHEVPDTWGLPYRIVDGKLTSLAIHKVVFELIESSFTESQLSEWAISNLLPWRNRFSEWVGKLGDQVTEQLAREINSPQIENFEYYFLNENEQLTRRKPAVLKIGVPLGDPKWGTPLKESDFKLALDLVAAGESPSTIDILYTQAKTKFFRGEYRIAVLEAALAIELFALQTLMETFGDNFHIDIAGCKNAVTPKSTLGDLVQCANEIGLISKKIFSTNQVGTRNDAAHRDIEISLQSADEFLYAVKRALDLRSS